MKSFMLCVMYQFLTFLFLLVSYCEGVSRTESGLYCISPCKPTNNGAKPTCYYTYTASEACKPGGDILEYYTNNGKTCNGRCGKFDNTNYEWCFNEYLSSWNYCDGTPQLMSFLNESVHNPFTKTEYCRLKNEPQNYVQEGNPPRRMKRRINNNTCNVNNNYQCTPGIRLNRVETIIDGIIEDTDNFITTHYGDPDNPNPDNPLLTVSTINFADITSPDPARRIPVTLTVAMRARIIPRHMESPRGDISSEVRSQLSRMDREDDDEAGHLLADSLGGVSAPFNFAPQSPMLNRAVMPAASLVVPSSWWDVEALIRGFLRRNRGNSVFWNLLVEYRLLPASRRPTGFRLTVSFFNQYRALTNYEGGAVHEYYFPNVPTVACSNLNHPWWSHWHTTR